MEERPTNATLAYMAARLFIRDGSPMLLDQAEAIANTEVEDVGRRRELLALIASRRGGAKTAAGLVEVPLTDAEKLAAGGKATTASCESFPIPFPVTLLKSEDEKRKEAQLTDRLPATLENPSIENNPPIVPFNGPHNPEYNRNFTFAQVKGLPDVVDMFETALVKPEILGGIYSRDTGSAGIILYGVAGTGKTSAFLAAVNLACGSSSGGCPLWSPDNTTTFRTQDEARTLDETPELKGWVKLNFWVVPPGKSNEQGHYEMPKIVAISVAGTQISSMWKNEGARRMSRYYQMARRVQPCILFFDEADPFLDPRIDTNADVTATMKTEITTADQQVPKPQVFTILATNNPQLLPEAILSRFTGSIIEVGLPDRAARRSIIAKAIYNNLKLANWKPSGEETGPIYWIANAQQTLDALAKWTRPPETLDQYKNGELKLWSGRDLRGMVYQVVTAAKKRLETSTHLFHCRGDGSGPPCSFYENNGDIYVVDEARGTIRAADLINARDGSSGKIRVPPITLKDFEDEWPKVTSTVTKESIGYQLRFNQSPLGRAVAVPPGPGQLFVDDLFGGRIGANTTVPDS